MQSFWALDLSYFGFELLRCFYDSKLQPLLKSSKKYFLFHYMENIPMSYLDTFLLSIISNPSGLIKSNNSISIRKLTLKENLQVTLWQLMCIVGFLVMKPSLP